MRFLDPAPPDPEDDEYDTDPFGDPWVVSDPDEEEPDLFDGE
jgi:hypothetical protein